jgi:hypothetical protein
VRDDVAHRFQDRPRNHSPRFTRERYTVDPAHIFTGLKLQIRSFTLPGQNDDFPHFSNRLV